MDLESFSLLLVLGKGSFGKVQYIGICTYIHATQCVLHVCLYYVVLSFMPQYTMCKQVLSQEQFSSAYFDTYHNIHNHVLIPLILLLLN